MLSSVVLRRTLAALLIATIGAISLWRPATPVRAGTYPYLVLIVMDGFRPDYTTLAPMRHLHDLMARGTSYDTAWVGQMESETPTGHATIATGVYPRKHGVVGFGWRDPTTGGFTYMPTDLRMIRGGNLTRQMEAGGAPSLSDLIHARNRHDLTVSMSGEKYYAAATLGGGADYILYGKDSKNAFRPTVISANVPPASTHYTSITGDAALDQQDRFVASLAVRMADSLRPRALLVNLPSADIAGHYYGGMSDPADMAPIVKGDDWAIGRIVAEYKHLGLLDRTLFVVTADHGMAANRHIVPIHAMYNAVRTADGLAMEEEFRITVGSIWLREPQRAARLASTLAVQKFPGVEGALYKTGAGVFVAEGTTAGHLPHALIRAYLDLANTEAGPTGPEVILPYGEDTTGLTVAGKKRWGSHGGFSWGVQHIPLILAGPGVGHAVSHYPAKLVDVAPTIERLLGLPIPSAVDGVVLADALLRPAAADQQAQAAVRTDRLRDVRALQAHSAAQSGQSR